MQDIRIYIITYTCKDFGRNRGTLRSKANLNYIKHQYHPH